MLTPTPMLRFTYPLYNMNETRTHTLPIRNRKCFRHFLQLSYHIMDTATNYFLLNFYYATYLLTLPTNILLNHRTCWAFNPLNVSKAFARNILQPFKCFCPSFLYAFITNCSSIMFTLFSIFQIK